MTTRKSNQAALVGLLLCAVLAARLAHGDEDAAVSPPALCETRNPVVTITSAPPPLVSYDVTAMTIAGTNDPAVVGGIWWSNALTLAAGAAQVSSFEFQVSNIALAVGTNVISVYGTNIVEIQTNASVTIVREQDDLPPVIAPDALVFPGTNDALLEAGVATALVWRVAGIWDNADGTNLLLPSIAILTTNDGTVVAQPGTNVPNMAGRLAWTPWGLESETTAYVVRIDALDSTGNRINRIFSRNVLIGSWREF